MTSKDPDLITELTIKVSALEESLSELTLYSQTLSNRVTTLVRSVVRDGQILADIERRVSKLEKNGK